MNKLIYLKNTFNIIILKSEINKIKKCDQIKFLAFKIFINHNYKFKQKIQQKLTNSLKLSLFNLEYI